MGLSPGQRLGPYEVLATAGAGGMGEVYKGRDTRLDRSVAIKVLPAHVAQDPQARDRFEREARAVAALNHPHICTLHDVGRQDGVDFLVMEYVEGETLARRLSAGPLPIALALSYAHQIASALEQAHGAGIVHRDLKPANVMLTGAGVKLLDFGLAKSAFVDRADAPTALSAPSDLTTPGTILGTVQYMAPEQLEGAAADVRTDVFAFGAMLFEMLTGQKAFAGSTPAAVIAAILRTEPPPVSALLPASMPSLDRLVARCLAKNPAERWQTARDLVRELSSIADGNHHTRTLTRESADSATGISRARLLAAAAVAGALLVAAILFGRSSRTEPEEAATASVVRGTPQVAVLPFRVIDAADDTKALSVGVADSIITQLANVQGLRVRPTPTIMEFSSGPVDPSAAGRQLKVDYVLTGTIQHAQDTYRFNVQLFNVKDASPQWGRNIDVTRRDLLGLQDQVARQVVTALHLELSAAERTRLDRRSTTNPEAYEEYLTGRALLATYSNSTNVQQAIDHFAEALRKDPTFAAAEAGYAIAAGIFSVRFAYEPQASDWGRRAEEHANRALGQDPNLAEAHLAIASAAGTLYRNFDWPTVIKEARAALALNPNLDLAHSALARAFMHLGAFEQSETDAALAISIGGATNQEANRVLVSNRLLQGRFSEAGGLAEDLLRGADVPVLRQYLGLSLFYAGDPARGRQVLADVRRPDGGTDTRSRASLAGVLAASGARDEASRTVAEVSGSGYMDHHVAYALGAAEAQLGHAALAVKWLRQASDTGFPCYPWFDKDPLLAPIRADPGFSTFMNELRAKYETTQALIR
jgi:TolB-like protein